MQMLRFTAASRLLLALRCASTSYSISSPSPSGKQVLREVLRRRDSQLREDSKGSGRDGAEKDLFSGAESIAAINLLKNRETCYDSFSRRKSLLVEEKSKQSVVQDLSDKNSNAKNAYFPLLAEKLDEPSGVQKNAQNGEKNLEANQSSQEDVKIVADRGFFVQNYLFCDEYHRATADELPDHEMNEIPYRIVNNAEVGVELIPFNEPGGEIASINLKKRERRAKWKVHREEALSDVGEWMEKYGDEADEVVPPLKDVHCAGCGASFHCNSSSLPGFVPVRLFQEIERNSKRPPIYQRTDYMCRRCFLYKEYQFLLNVNVCDIDYRSIMGHLKLVQEALILLVVDMTDLHSSIFRDLPEIIGEGKPMIVIGNKVDLLPPDASRGYLKRYQDALKNTVTAAGFGEKFNILKFSLVSAKNGYGIEDLITNIYSKWMGPSGTLRSNIYVVGCTNAGKSTLFNTFLQSDLCKVRALDLVERVTTSIWPGTTLSLLKFPIWNPSSFKLEMRRRRLLKMYKWRQKEKHVAEELYKKTQDTKYITLQGYVGNTFKELEQDQQPQNLQEVSQKFYGELDGRRRAPAEEDNERNVHGRLNLNDPIFLAGNWCYDTPGTVNNDQIFHLLTLDELINVIPRRMIIPRTFITYEGDSILIGGIGRVDLLAAKSYNDQLAAVFLTVFASDRLPLNCLKTADVKRYLKHHRGSEKLGAPLGDENRLCQFPPLRSHSMWVENTAENPKSEGCADVALSSVGWVSVTSASAKRIRLRAWTPDARGIVLRTPPIVRNAAELRGRRIPGTAGYETLLPAEIEESIYSRGRLKKQSLHRISHQLTNEMKPSGWAADGKRGRDTNDKCRDMASYDPRAVSFHFC